MVLAKDACTIIGQGGAGFIRRAPRYDFDVIQFIDIVRDNE